MPRGLGTPNNFPTGLTGLSEPNKAIKATRKSQRLVARQNGIADSQQPPPQNNQLPLPLNEQPKLINNT